MAQIAVAAIMGAAQLYKGQQQKKLKEAEAVGYRDAARRRLGVAHREMAEERRNKEFMYSRALAVMGAQGATQADPGINALLADLNAEGEYRVMSRLYAGQNEAEGLQFRAEAAIREGRAAEKASYVSAVTSAVSAYYGMGGGQPGEGFSKFTTSEQMKRGLEASRVAQKTSGTTLPSYGPRGFAF